MLVKYRLLKKNILGPFIALFIFGMIYPVYGSEIKEFKQIDPNIVPNELIKLATVTKANYEKIKTLQGKVSFESMGIYREAYAADLLKQDAGITVKEPNEIAQRAEGTVEFKVDLEKNLFFKYMLWPKPMEYIDLDTGLTYTSLSGSMERTKIITGEYEIESYPDRKKKDGTILGRIARKQLRKQPEIITDDSDPRICFNIGRPVWELLSQFSEGLRSYERGDIDIFYDVVLEKEQTTKGVSYHVQLVKPGATYPFDKFILDGEKGFNPTYIEVKNDKGITISEITTDFIKIDGIFLPSKRHVLQYDGTDGCLRRELKSTFSNMQVNKTLPENTFSLDNLGLCNGDKFVDNIEGREYIYQDANLVFVKEVSK